MKSFYRFVFNYSTLRWLQLINLTEFHEINRRNSINDGSDVINSSSSSQYQKQQRQQQVDHWENEHTLTHLLTFFEKYILLHFFVKHVRHPPIHPMEINWSDFHSLCFLNEFSGWLQILLFYVQYMWIKNALEIEIAVHETTHPLGSYAAGGESGGRFQWNLLSFTFILVFIQIYFGVKHICIVELSSIQVYMFALWVNKKPLPWIKYYQ